VFALAGVVVYAATKSERFPMLALALGVAGLILTVAGVVGRWSPLLALGLVGVGAAYAVFLGLRPESVDPWAPFVAAALFAGAELGFSALESRVARQDPKQKARRMLVVAAGVLGTAILGSGLLLVGGQEHGGVALEAAGILAAVTLMAIVAGLAARQGRS
jgi:hypothetical protein